MGSWYSAFQNLPCPGCTRRIPGNTTRCPYCTSELEWGQVGAGSTSLQITAVFVGIISGLILGGFLGGSFGDQGGLGAILGALILGYYFWHRAKTRGIDALIIKPNYQNFRPTMTPSNISNNQIIELNTTQSHTSTCHQCNSPRNDGDLFCINCGAKYINVQSSSVKSSLKTCHQCNSLQNDDDLFCINCGANQLSKKDSVGQDHHHAIKPNSKLMSIFNSLKKELILINENRNIAFTKSKGNLNFLDQAKFFFSSLSKIQLYIVLGVVTMIFFGGYRMTSSGVSAKIGVKYEWDPMGYCKAEGVGQSGLSTECLTKEQYKKFCNASSGITKGSIFGFTYLDPRASALANGGSVSNIKVHWDGSNEKFGCIVNFTVSGILNGTSTKVNVEKGASSFIYNEDNKLLVSDAALY
jgi:RNA polymerase subunit RPABC4/transcription elongation factor Spt4